MADDNIADIYDTVDALEELLGIMGEIKALENEIELLLGEEKVLRIRVDIDLDNTLSELYELINLLKEVKQIAKGLDHALPPDFVQSIASATKAINDISPESIKSLEKLENVAKSALSSCEDVAEHLGESFSTLKDPIDEVGEAVEEVSDKVKKQMKITELASTPFDKVLSTGLMTEFNALASTIAAKADIIRHPIKSLKELAAAFIVGRQESHKANDEMRKDSEKALDTFKGKLAGALKKIGEIAKGIGKAVLAVAKAIGKAIMAIAKAVVTGIIEMGKAMGKAILDATKMSEGAETINKSFDRSFGDNSDAVDNWATNFAEGIHRNKTEVKGFLTESNAVFKNAGVEDAEAAKLSEITTSISYDLARDMKVDDGEMFNAIKSAVEGSTGALDKYGISLNDAMLGQSALEMGLGDNIKELDEATMAQVRLNAIVAQTGDAHGAAANSIGGLKGGMKAMQSVMDGFMTQMGDKFAPVFDKLFTTILGFLPTVEPMITNFLELMGEKIVELLPCLIELAEKLFPVLFDILMQLAPVFLDLAAQLLPMLADVLLLVVSAVAPLIPPLVQILMDVLMPLLPVIMQIVEALLPPMVSLIQALMPAIEALVPVFVWFAEVLADIAGLIGKVIDSLAKFFADGNNKKSEAVKGVISSAFSVVDPTKPLPGHAKGTTNFTGGWTEIHEKGGEIISTRGHGVAYLPAGSTILPADKSAEVINRLAGEMAIPENAIVYLAPQEVLNEEIRKHNNEQSLGLEGDKNSDENPGKPRLHGLNLSDANRGSGRTSAVDTARKVLEIVVTLQANGESTSPELVQALHQTTQNPAVMHEFKQMVRAILNEHEDEEVKKAVIQGVYN